MSTQWADRVEIKSSSSSRVYVVAMRTHQWMEDERELGGFRAANGMMSENGSEFDHANVGVLKAEQAQWAAEDKLNAEAQS